MHGWTNLSSSVDSVFLFIMGISLVLLVGVTGAMVYFAVRYRRSKHPHAENIEGNLALEIVWTVIPTLLVLAIFWVGWKGFVYMRTVPQDAMLVKVTARMWSWRFTYENGATSEVLKVPVNQPVKLAITSSDVLHSLSIPAFRVKEDAVPGRENYLWFQPELTGSYDLFCTEYCGMGHSAMVTKVEVMSEQDFNAWYRGATGKASDGRSGPDGVKLFADKGCSACHSIDGSPKVGPTLKGVSGHRVTVLTGGKEREITATDAYLRKSLVDPQADVVKGFPPIMPSQKGVLKDAEIDALVEYMKGLH
ncbi:MAG: cytochrome c oxidase subunit II [Nitrospirota bacterium]